MVSILRLFRLGTRFAAWATPHVREWHRKRHLNRSEGERHLQAGNHSEAEKHLTLAIAEAEQRRYSVAKRIQLQLALAEAQREQGKLMEAERSLRTAILDAVKERDSAMQAVCLDGLAQVLLARGDFRDAESTIQQAMSLEPSMPRPDPQATARRARQLAIARHKDGRLTDAMPAFQKALALHEQAYGAEHVETANLLSEVAAIQHDQGNHTEAQR